MRNCTSSLSESWKYNIFHTINGSDPPLCRLLFQARKNSIPRLFSRENNALLLAMRVYFPFSLRLANFVKAVNNRGELKVRPRKVYIRVEKFPSRIVNIYREAEFTTPPQSDRSLLVKSTTVLIQKRAFITCVLFDYRVSFCYSLNNEHRSET